MIKEATIDAQNEWTDSISPDFRNVENKGLFNLSISDGDAPTGWVATVTLQRAFPDGDPNVTPVKTGWKDVLTFTADSEQIVEEIENGVLYRLGVATGDFTSGKIDVRLSY